MPRNLGQEEERGGLAVPASSLIALPACRDLARGPAGRAWPTVPSAGPLWVPGELRDPRGAGEPAGPEVPPAGV